MTSTTSTPMQASPDDVWAVLADGWLYALWVVGASRIRQVDDAWPAVGAVIHHSVGSWPLLIDDTTEVTRCEPGRRLDLQARAWPTGEAAVEITIEPGPEGVVVTMAEDASHGPARFIPSPIRRAALDLRNAESLTRLRYLVERRAHPA